MRSSAPASAAVATPCRRCPLPAKQHAIRQSGAAVRPLSYAARLLIRGTSPGAPNWHQPTQSSPSYTRAACARPSRTRRSLAERLRPESVRESSSWKPMHQQPPKMPLLRSTNAANAVHVDSSRALTVYVGPAMKSRLTWGHDTSLFVPNQRRCRVIRDQVPATLAPVANARVPCLWLCGPPGVGKSSVGYAIFQLVYRSG